MVWWGLGGSYLISTFELIENYQRVAVRNEIPLTWIYALAVKE